MKILVITPFPPSDESTGKWIEPVLGEMISRFNDIDVLVATQKSSSYYEEEGRFGKKMHVLPMWDQYMSSEEISSELYKIMLSNQFDVIHINFNITTFGDDVAKNQRIMEHLLSMSRELCVPSVVTLHTIVVSRIKQYYYYFILHGKKFGIMTRILAPTVKTNLSITIQRILFSLILNTPLKFLEKILLKNYTHMLEDILEYSDMVVLPSTSQLNFLRENYARFGNKLSFIPLGLSKQKKSSDTIEDNTEAKSLPVRLSIFGYITPYKGTEELIEAIRILKDKKLNIRLTIGGSSPDEAYLDRIGRIIEMLSLKNEIEFKRGYIPSEEIERITMESDLLVYPYLDDGALSSSGVVFDFALPTNKKIVITNVPRLNDFIELSGVYVCKDSTPKSIAESIRIAFEDNDEFLNKRILQLKQFTPSAIMEKYKAVYDKVIDAKNK